METVGKCINSVLQNGSASKHSGYSKPMLDNRLTTLIFTRLSDLFGSKCLDRGIVIANQDGAYTSTFLLWARKLYGLTTQDIARGFEILERRAKTAGANGEEMWPPSYAEFAGMCEEARPIAAHKVFPRSLPEPENLKSKRKKAGEHELAKLRAMFD